MKNKAILLFCISILLFTSCKKFLSVDPPYAQDAENYFQTPDDYDRALTGAYDMLQGSFLSLWIGEIASDNSIAGGESVNDSQGLHQIDNMTHGGVNNELRNIMRWNYTGITRVNYIMENKDNIDFPEKQHILAEARFLRAYYYFELVKFFGDVPLIIDKRLGIEEAQQLPRAPKAEVYTQIEADLNFAIGVLNPVAAQKGRATKGAAQALLGKAYLYQKKFTEAASIFDEIRNSGLYSLITDYSQLFSASNENNSETVFDIQ
ncbi:MAG: RagB/SusD family nutrient uptake outer membrane protein, partial [Crocinitomicaceae bacterium]